MTASALLKIKHTSIFRRQRFSIFQAARCTCVRQVGSLVCGRRGGEIRKRSVCEITLVVVIVVVGSGSSNCSSLVISTHLDQCVTVRLLRHDRSSMQNAEGFLPYFGPVLLPRFPSSSPRSCSALWRFRSGDGGGQTGQNMCPMCRTGM